MRFGTIVLAYNDARFIPRAAASAHNPHFLIDGSTDNSEEVCQKMLLDYHNGDDCNQIQGWNRCLDWACEMDYDFVKFMHVDDMDLDFGRARDICEFEWDKLVATAHITMGEETGEILHGFSAYGEWDYHTRSSDSRLVKDSLYNGTRYGNMSMWWIPRRIFKTYRFDETFKWRADTDFLVRLHIDEGFIYLNYPCVIGTDGEHQMRYKLSKDILWEEKKRMIEKYGKFFEDVPLPEQEFYIKNG